MIYVMNSKKGQAHLQYLFIIGGAVLIAIVLLLIIIGLGDQGKESVNDQSNKSQKSMDSAVPASIFNIYPLECINYKAGEVKVNYSIPSSGDYYLVIMDYDNNPLSFIGSDGNNIPDGSSSYIVNINLQERNLSCTDTFWLKIISHKNGQEVKSALFNFRWDNATNATAYLSGGPPSGNYNGTGNITYQAIVPEGTTNLVWTLYSSAQGIHECYNHDTCTLSESRLDNLENGEHKINLKANLSPSGTIDVNRIFFVEVSPDPPSSFTGRIISPEDGSSFNYNDKIEFLSEYSENSGSVSCLWEYKLESDSSWVILSNDDCGFKIKANEIGTSGTYDLRVTATDEESHSFSDQIQFIIVKENEFTVKIINPEDKQTYRESDIIPFIADCSSNQGDVICVWRHKSVKEEKWEIIDYAKEACKFEAPVKVIGSEGEYDLKVTATDKENNVSEFQIQIGIKS